MQWIRDPGERMPPSKTVRFGQIISATCVLLLVLDGITKLFSEKHVVVVLTALGYPDDQSPLLGLLVLACTALYAIPTTTVLGAVLLTGWLGGATASVVRIGSPGHSYYLPIAVGVLVWLGLFLREARLRALFPFRR